MVHFVASLMIISSTMGDVDVADLARGAIWIGRVKVVSVRSSASGSVPTTIVSAQIVETLKGNGSQGMTIQFQAPGGERGKKRFMILGVPSFKVETEYVLFLTKDPVTAGSSAELLGWSAFRIVEDSRGFYVMRAGDTTIVETDSYGSRLIHDRSFTEYDVFVAEVFRSLN